MTRVHDIGLLLAAFAAGTLYLAETARAGTICGPGKNGQSYGGVYEATQCDPVIIKALERDGFFSCRLFTPEGIKDVYLPNRAACPKMTKTTE